MDSAEARTDAEYRDEIRGGLTAAEWTADDERDLKRLLDWFGMPRQYRPVVGDGVIDYDTQGVPAR